MLDRSLTWLRRPTSWIEIAAWAALVAFVVVSLGPALVGDGTFLNTGLLHNFAPWAATTKSLTTSTNVLDGDTLDSATPQVSLLVRLAHEGVFAQWNPYIVGGTELGGVPDSGAYSPLSLPWWILPLSYAPGVVKLLEIVAITVGMALLLRRWGMPRASWPIAALIYSSSGFMVAWTGWPQTRVAAFIPLLFWAIDRAAVELKARDVVGSGAILGSMLLGGFPAVVGYALFGGFIYFVWRSLAAQRNIRRFFISLGIAAGGVILGVLFSAWQIVPFASNAASVIDFGVRAQTGLSGVLGIRSLVSSWVPTITGIGSTGTRWGGSNPVEDYSYIGAASIALIAAALLIRPRFREGDRRLAGVVPVLTLVLAVSIGLVYFGGPLLSLARELPGLFDSNPVGRMRCMVEFAAAALAGIGFGKAIDPELLRDEMQRARKNPALYWTGRGIVALFVVVTGGWLLWQTRLDLRAVPAPYTHNVKVDVLIAGAIVLVAALAIAATWIFRFKGLSVAAGIGIAILVAVPATSSVRSWWPTAPVSTFYPTTPAIKYLENHLSDQQRYATAGQTTLPGTGSYFEIRSLTGHGFQTEQWKSLMASIDPASQLTPTYSTLSLQNLDTSVDSPIMNRLGVRYVVADPGYPIPGQEQNGPAPTSTTKVAAGAQPLSSATYAGPVSGVEITGPAATTGSTKGLTLSVAVVADGSGKQLASTTTWVGTLTGVRTVALKGDSIPADQSWHVQVSITGQDPNIPVDLGTTASGQVAVNLIRPIPNDDLRIVHTGDATIYERTGADDRVHWASSQQVLTDQSARVRALADPATPDDQVILSAPSAHQASGSGTATVRLDPTDVNETKATVTASKGGWLVVEDSLQRPGWSASVDGQRTQLVAADNAGAAVWVPAGRHVVTLHYSTPGIATGTFLTVGSIIVTLLVAFGTMFFRRRRAASASTQPAASLD